MTLKGFLLSGILRVAKNPRGGAPGSTRHLEINLAELDKVIKLSRGEDSASVQKRGAKDRSKGAQTDAVTDAAGAPKPLDNTHQITTTDESLDLSCCGEDDVFDWPPQLDTDEREAIEAVLIGSNNSQRQKQFALDELRAALQRREIPQKARWIKALLKNGVERTPGGKAYESSRRERSERLTALSLKPPEDKMEVDKSVGKERLRALAKSLKK